MYTVHLHYVSKFRPDQAYNSFIKHGWCVNLVEGYTASTCDTSIMPLPNGRLADLLQTNPSSYRTKLAIDQNQLRFWKHTANSNTIQIYAEHDIICKRDAFELPEFEDVLLLQLDNSTIEHLYNKVFVGYCNDIPTIKNGMHTLPADWDWIYKYDTKYKGAKLIPGAACYALTPQGARKLIAEVEEFTEQSDMIINDSVVDIRYITPAVVIFNNSITTTSLETMYEA